MMTIGIHERWTGQAGRTSALRDFLEYVLGRSDVRLMRRLDIARWWLENHESWQGDSSAVAAR